MDGRQLGLTCTGNRLRSTGLKVGQHFLHGSLCVSVDVGRTLLELVRLLDCRRAWRCWGTQGFFSHAIHIPISSEVSLQTPQQPCGWRNGLLHQSRAEHWSMLARGSLVSQLAQAVKFDRAGVAAIPDDQQLMACFKQQPFIWQN